MFPVELISTGLCPNRHNSIPSRYRKVKLI
nr:MAG TPA: hypothetical protein [Caudoviricetes sp.]DAU01649.1 MAG TPA: hypothetical protein [Caudoviricetes sp.]